MCDNSCGTFYCCCGLEFHILNNVCYSGHSLTCGIYSTESEDSS